MSNVIPISFALDKPAGWLLCVCQGGRWGVRLHKETRPPRQSPRPMTGSSSFPPPSPTLHGLGRKRSFPPIDGITSSLTSPSSLAAELSSCQLWLGVREHPQSLSSDVFFNWPDTQAFWPDQVVGFFPLSFYCLFLFPFFFSLLLSAHFPLPIPIPRDMLRSFKVLKYWKDCSESKYMSQNRNNTKLYNAKLSCMLKLDLHPSPFAECKILGKLTKAEFFSLFWCVCGWEVYLFSRPASTNYQKLGGFK